MGVCVPLDPPNYIHFFFSKTSNDRMNKSNGHCFFFVSHFIMALIQILCARINEKKNEKQYDKFQHN